MGERDQYGDLISGATLDGWTLARIADGTPGKKPFDFFGWTGEGTVVAVEAKEWTKRELSTTLPMEVFTEREHQITWLNKIANDGGIALVAVYHKPARTMVLYGTNGQALYNLQKIAGHWRGWPTTPEWIAYLRQLPGTLEMP